MMKRTLIKDIQPETVVTISGWLENLRDKRTMQFLVIKDITGSIQVTVEKEKLPEIAEKISATTLSSVVTITGTVYKNEYVNYSMLTKYVFLSNKLDGEQQFKESNVSEEQVRSAQGQIEEYVDLLNSGKKGIKEIANIFKEKEQLSTDSLETETICLKDADVSDEILNKLKELDVGKADYIKINDTFVLLFKNDISNNLPDISNNEIRRDILKSFKVDDFYSKIESVKSKMNIELNSKLIKEIVPEKLFKLS